ncbi:MAG: hypothetical protein JWO52_6828, partial [Gammaproteobacteria bacterium]|nr:hypothetical protein [Gammaproteobacteria bacterium]
MLEPVGGGSSTQASYNINNPDPVAAAHKVLSTGGGGFLGIGQDYDSRVATLANEISQGDASYGEALMKEIFKEDPNALQWLTPARANALQQSGRISNEGAVAESLAAAYNHGDLAQQTYYEGQAPYTAQLSYAKGTALDQMVRGFSGPEGLQGQATSAQNVRDFLDFMGTSRGPEATQFRTNFADHLINTYVAGPGAAAVQYNHRDQQSVAASIAANLLSEASVQNPNAATRVLSQYKDQIPAILQAAENGGNWMTLNNVTVNSDGRIVNSVHVGSGVPQLIDAVAQSPASATNDAVALAFARLPATTPGLFKSPNADAQQNTTNLGQLFTTHFQGIMTTLANYDPSDLGVKNGLTVNQYMENAADLGSLLNVTAFNPNSPWAFDVKTMLINYAGSLKTQLNTPGLSGPAQTKASDQLAMVTAAADDALAQRYNDIQAQTQATKDTVAFIANLALAGLPVGDMAKDKVAGLISDAFSDSSGRIATALTGVSKSLIGTGTDQLSSDAQAALVQALG